MTIASQRKATANHRSRSIAGGLVRIEVQARKGDAAIIRALADGLRKDKPEAQALRAEIERALIGSEIKDVLDIFGSDLPDEIFEGVFEQPRESRWRDIDL